MSAIGTGFLTDLAAVIGLRGQDVEIESMGSVLRANPRGAEGLSLARAVVEGLSRSRAPGDAPIQWLSPFSSPLATEAAAVAVDPGQPETARQDAIALIAYLPTTASRTHLLSLLDPQNSQDIQRAGLAALDRLAPNALGQDLIPRWNTFTPGLRADSLAFLLKRSERAADVLSAITSGVVRAAELSPTQQEFLRTHRDEALRRRAIAILGAAPPAERQPIVDAFQPALRLTGVSARGQVVFTARCATCHRHGNEGHAVGPDLATVRNAGREKILVHIIDPNREVAANFMGYLLETREGETLSGVIAGESAAGVVLRQAGGIEITVPRTRIASLQGQGKSLMPDGLEAGLTEQDMADLLALLEGHVQLRGTSAPGRNRLDPPGQAHGQ